MPDAPEAVRLTEFNKLRDEITQRTAHQHALMALNLTFVGTVVGFVLSAHAPKAVLLVIPLVSPMLGILWLDHHVAIARIGRYISGPLWIWTPSWEARIDADRRSERAREFVYWGAVLMVFFLDGARPSTVTPRTRRHDDGRGGRSDRTV